MNHKGSSFTLNNGVAMPAVGLGVFQSSKEATASAVRLAIQDGYGLIDTASAYQNEAEVGQGIRDSGVNRNDIFVTTKLRPADYGFDETLRAFDKSMSLLGLDVLDLYLLHWPIPRDFSNTMKSWNACERILAEGRVRAIGVCNFRPVDLDALIECSDIVPAVNQIELHPFFVQRDHDQAHAKHGIITQAWSPIGGIQRYWGSGNQASDPLHHPVIADIAGKHGKTAAQIVLRWQLQLGHSVIPKSTNPTRIAENIRLFDFELSQQELDTISALDTGKRGGPDPAVQGTPAGK